MSDAARHEEETAMLNAIRRTWPDCPTGPVRAAAGGQHHMLSCFAENPGIMVRVARHPGSESAARLQREHGFLLSLPEELPIPLPLPVPRPLYAFFEEHGLSYFAYARLSGEPLAPEVWSRLALPVRQSLARDFGRFLLALHATGASPYGPPADDDWASLYRDAEETVFGHLPPTVEARLRRHFEAFLAGRPDTPATLIHGDFGTTNLLWDPKTGHATGVLDFTEAGFGDPALDLAAFHASFGDLALSDTGYPVDSSMRERIDFYEGTFALQEAVFGARHQDAAAFAAGIDGVITRFSR